MQTEYMIVYAVMAVLLACVMEVLDVGIKKIKAKIKAKRVEKAEQQNKEGE